MLIHFKLINHNWLGNCKLIENEKLQYCDYFFSRKEFIKAKEFYIQILYLKNLHEELYKYAKSQLGMISNG